MNIETRTIAQLTAITAASLLIAGCSSPEKSLSPKDRFIEDFVVNPSGFGDPEPTNCLIRSPFTTVTATESLPLFSYDAETDVLSVTSIGGEVLQVTGFNPPADLLSPANEASQDILAAAGCEYSPLTNK